MGEATAGDGGREGTPAYETLLATPLSARERALLERARSHAADFGSRAAVHDAAGTFPVENFAAMRESGYAHMTLPATYAGEDVSLLELCACQEQLAQGCAGTAIGVNMHLFTLASMAADAALLPTGPQAQVAMGLRAIGERRSYVSGSFSETGQAGAYFLPATQARRAPGGWVVRGRKAYASNWPVAEVVSALVQVVDTAAGPARVAMVSVPKGTPGLSSPGAGSWEVLGMRASGSYAVEWEDVFVAEMLMPPSRPAASFFAEMSAFGAWFNVSVSAVYTGVAQAAIDWVTAFLRERRPAGVVGGRSLRHMPGLQYQLGEMVALTAASRGLIRASAEDWGARAWGPEEAASRGGICKYVCTNNAVRVVGLAMDIAGGPGLFRSGGLERLYRDVRAGKAHPPSDPLALELIAKRTLGIPLGFEPRWG